VEEHTGGTCETGVERYSAPRATIFRVADDPAEAQLADARASVVPYLSFAQQSPASSLTASGSAQTESRVTRAVCQSSGPLVENCLDTYCEYRRLVGYR
jgi:hypothetical protein